MFGKDSFKKAVRNDKIIGGIVLILFGVGAIVFGVKIYNNQNFVQSCTFNSGLSNQSNLIVGFPCLNQSGISILSIIPVMIGIAILLIGVVFLIKGLKNNRNIQKQIR